MEYFSRTPIKNDVLGIISQLSSRKKNPRTPFRSDRTNTNSREFLSFPLQFVEFTPEKLCVDKCQKKYSSNVEIDETHTSEVSKLNVKTTSLNRFSPEASSDFPLTNLYESAFDNSPDAQSLAHVSPIVKYSPEASPKTGIDKAAVDDNFGTQLFVQTSPTEHFRDPNDNNGKVDDSSKILLVSTKSDMNRSMSLNYSNIRTVAHTSLKIDNLFDPNNKSNVSSGDDDDDAFERFIESQKKTKITKSEDDQSSDWLSGESEEDDDSSSTSPYQTFYYRIHNQVDSSEVRKPSLPLFDSDSSESDRENSSSVKNNQSVTTSVPKRLDVPNCHKSTKKDEKPNSSDVPVEDFVYSLYPVNDNDRKSTAHRKIRHPDALKFVQKFKPNRCELAKKLYEIYNEKIFSNQLPSNLEIIWNRRLLKTAGLCKYMTRTTTHSDKTSTQVRIAQILLSEKVCTTAERVRDTLLHEVCHAAVWLLDGVNDGHGRRWKAWANRAHRIWPRLPMVSVVAHALIDTANLWIPRKRFVVIVVQGLNC
ncbi:unnamed protein product [Trichobilharzia szidati]|nr:unnamed protein product [Trichobilharzia szidati]